MPCVIRLLANLFQTATQSCAALASRSLFATIFLLTACSGENGQDPIVLMTDTPGGVDASATLAWDPVHDTSVSGYFVHYGKQSGGGAGHCPPDHAVFVSQPNANITSLEYSTQYFFSVSAYNGVESACSNEVTTVIAAGA